MNSFHPSRIIVDLNAYAANLAQVKSLIGAVQLIPILKANAYGHGLVPVARAAEKAGATLLGVATVPEGIELRENGVLTPILVMVSPPRNALPLFLDYGLTLTVADKAMAQELNELAALGANRVMPVHCKVDTGMGRQGVNYEDAFDTLQYISRSTHLDLQGIYTHFPSADVKDDAYTQNQIAVFAQLLKQVNQAGFPYELAHAANSAAIVNYPDSLFDAVRPGLISYGVWPTDADSHAVPLRPVLRWETSVVQVRTLPEGAFVGYGRTYAAKRKLKTAVLPVGYADGYKHQLSNKASVLIHGQRCQVLGSVCMDQIVADVSAVANVAWGDTATLLGVDGDECITAGELAQLADTIPYDILTGIGPRVHREYIGLRENES